MSTYEHRDDRDRNNSREDGSKTQLFLAKGRNHGMDPRALADFISEETQIDQSLIDSIKVLDDFSFFAVPNDEAGRILDYFQDKAGEGRPLVSKAKRKTSSGGGSGGGFDRDRPRRDFGDRPRRDYDDRPRRDYGDRDDRRSSGNSGNYGNYGNRNNNGG